MTTNILSQRTYILCVQLNEYVKTRSDINMKVFQHYTQPSRNYFLAKTIQRLNNTSDETKYMLISNLPFVLELIENPTQKMTRIHQLKWKL